MWPIAAALLMAAATGCATHRQAPPPSRGQTCIWPLPAGFSTITSEYGCRNGAHHGVDVRAPKGTPVYAVADGQVTFTGEARGYGKLVRIAHVGGIESLYAHLKTFETKAGRNVRQGCCIGKVGATGNSNGFHLHFEMRRNGTPINPGRYLPPPR